MTTDTTSLRSSVNDLLAGRVGAPSDADREAAAQRIGRGYAEGRITVQEFDERLAALWRAATHAELRILLADMPDGPAPAITAPKSAPTDRPMLRLLTGGWLAINVVNFVVWALICIIGFRWESPWWLWSLVPAGLVLAGAWWATTPGRTIGGRTPAAWLKGR
ncbi:MAG TPA: DUF1707 domain-containing protein [Mycobacteriales bacterium]|nr:DUF1707 domain-containing protein [Mycobacteriales bacterium]